MDLRVFPSIMCSKPWDMLTYIKEFEKCNIEAIHCDVMDGNFVPNLALGSGIFRDIHNQTNIPLDLHLMCQNPDEAFDYFDVRKGDRVSFHPQTIDNSDILLRNIKEKGAWAGLALNPAISIDCLVQYKDLLDFVLIMSVEPGFAGQRMIPESLNKIEELCKKRNEWGLNFDIFVDGDCTAVNAKQMSMRGADGFVVGSALINSKNKACDFKNTYNEYKGVFYAE